MILHRLSAFKRLFMNPFRKRAYVLRRATEHPWSCTPGMCRMSVMEKKCVCVSVATQPACGLTPARVSVTIPMGFCRCGLAKAAGWAALPPGDRPVCVTGFPLHFPVEAGLLCLRL